MLDVQTLVGCIDLGFLPILFNYIYLFDLLPVSVNLLCCLLSAGVR